MNIIHHPLESFEHIIRHNPQYGLIATFIVAFVESLAIVGSIVPGTITMGIVGSMVGAALLPLVPTILIAFSGSYVGDIISFIVGKRCRQWVKNLTWIKKNDQWLSKAEEFIKNYGFMSIVIGRFFGPMRSMVPMIAGTLKMNNIKFLIAAIPSAMLWAIVYLIPGIMIGMFSREFSILSKENVIWGSIILICACVFSYYFPTTKNKLVSCYNNWLKQFGNHAQTVNLRIIACIFLTCFTTITFLLPWLNSKYPIYFLFQSIQVGPLNYIMTFITLLVDKITFVLFIIIIALCMKNKGMRHFLISATICIAIMYALKNVIHIHRPPKISEWTSFPSGHSIRASFLLNYLYLYLRPTNKSWRTAVWVLITWIMISRLYLGAHWWPDVIAGTSLGTAIAYFSHSFNSKKGVRYTNIGAILLAMFIAYSSVAFLKLNNYINFFTGPMANINLNHDKWLSNSSKVPIFLDNRFGKPNQPLNINWLSTIEGVKDILKKDDWVIHNWPKNWYVRLQQTILNPEIKYLPAVAKLYNNKAPVILAFKKDRSHLYSISIWESNYEVNHRKLLIGSSLSYKLTTHNNHQHYVKDKYYTFLINKKHLNAKYQNFIKSPYKTIKRTNSKLKITKIYPRTKHANHS